MTSKSLPDQATLFGHPTGLFTLFFAEMWERFSYYGMRALLLFYMIKGFLGFGDREAYAIYGAYTALVYMTPFFGGLIADRLLGARRAVILGGTLMATGHLLMTVQNSVVFFIALAVLISGNGFFKPNISTMVGTLYTKSNPKRDGGFTIFYMGVNLGAAMSPLLCGYIGETYGWHYGFGLATVGMLVGLAVFVVPTRIAQGLILVGAFCTGITMFFLTDNVYLMVLNILVGVALIAAGIIAVMALNRGGLPKQAGAPSNPDRLKFSWLVYMGTLVAIPVLACLVWANARFKLISEAIIAKFSAVESGFAQILAVFLEECSTPAGLILILTLISAITYLLIEALRSALIERHRMLVALILMFFSLLFWSFFEQAGSSINNFTDRNVDRVIETQTVTTADVGKTLDLYLSQEQVGYRNGDQLITLDVVDKAQDNGTSMVQWTITNDHVGMGIAESMDDVIPASTYQSINPIFIMIFGLVFTALWAFLNAKGREPSTPVKFAFGLIQLGLGFGALWYGALMADERGMVFMGWLLLGYLFHTTGELCLSPVGLSMVTKLAPTRLVSTMMGCWFLLSAAANLLAAVIAQFTGVESVGGHSDSIPIPSETVLVYGSVFKVIAISALISGGICLLLSPLLKTWMHEGEDTETEKNN
jgi:POT family proton-dependent oligopeptide transporter